MVYKWLPPCYNTSSSRSGIKLSALQQFLHNFESEDFLMMTILFVAAVLCGSYFLLSALDNGCAKSREVGSYLHYEYNATMLSRL